MARRACLRRAFDAFDTYGASTAGGVSSGSPSGESDGSQASQLGRYQFRSLAVFQCAALQRPARPARFEFFMMSSRQRSGNCGPLSTKHYSSAIHEVKFT